MIATYWYSCRIKHACSCRGFGKDSVSHSKNYDSSACEHSCCHQRYSIIRAKINCGRDLSWACAISRIKSHDRRLCVSWKWSTASRNSKCQNREDQAVHHSIDAHSQLWTKNWEQKYEGQQLSTKTSHFISIVNGNNVNPSITCLISESIS
jgi:hypothetical protein